MTNIVLYITCIIILAIILVITIRLFLKYCKNEEYHDYFFIFNICFTIILLFNMLTRSFPLSKADGKGSDEISGGCYVQAFLLSLFDKLIITLITSFSIISYIIKFKENIKDNQKNTYLWILMGISLVLSLVLTIIFIIQGTSNRSEFCYVETKSYVKLWIDSIVTGILYIINLIITLIMVFGNDKDENKEEESYKWDLILFYLRLLFNLTTVTYVLHLILRILPFEGYAKDFIYVFLCLIVNILFVANYKLKEYIKTIYEKYHCCNNKNNSEILINSIN